MDLCQIWYNWVNSQSIVRKFFCNRLSGFDSVGGQNSPSPLTWPVAVNTLAGATVQPAITNCIKYFLNFSASHLCTNY